MGAWTVCTSQNLVVMTQATRKFKVRLCGRSDKKRG